MYFALKTLITALMVAGISELARRHSLIAAALASLPLTSILAMIWLYHDAQDTQKICELSIDILWMVIPSLLFFVMLPLFIRLGYRFYPAMILSCIVMSVGYSIFFYIKKSYF